MLTEYVRIALRRHILRRSNPEGKPPPILRTAKVLAKPVRVNPFARRQWGTALRCRLVIRRRSCNLISSIWALKQSAKLFIVTRLLSPDVSCEKITEATLFDVPILSWQELEESLYGRKY